MAHHDHRHPAGGHAQVGHVVSLRVLFGVWGALVVLTIVTVAVTYIPAELLGPFTLWVALLIAGVKAALVALYFMHLRWDRPLNGIVMAISIGFVILFVGGALTDTAEYQGDMIPGYAPGMQGKQPKAEGAP
ncbi:MAG TPA: cytochrome C oxidase subunit IV family protein [Candidatus Polarisedimenticolaceae bacterium]|nr:cytochrome C oxidase subunit IV family protein [Candidatus Polarisedimenticolaceae bacterium]